MCLAEAFIIQMYLVDDGGGGVSMYVHYTYVYDVYSGMVKQNGFLSNLFRDADRSPVGPDSAAASFVSMQGYVAMFSCKRNDGRLSPIPKWAI